MVKNPIFKIRKDVWKLQKENPDKLVEYKYGGIIITDKK